MIALNKSFTKTKGFMLQVFVVAIIEGVLVSVAGGGSSIGWALSSLPGILIVSVIGAVIYAALFTLKDLFMFYAWEDQKNWVQ